MNNEPEKQTEKSEESRLTDKISGMAQVIIGELETIGGVITGDPTTQAEGDFNVEVGNLRDKTEEDLEKGEEIHREKNTQNVKE